MGEDLEVLNAISDDFVEIISKMKVPIEYLVI